MKKSVTSQIKKSCFHAFNVMVIYGAVKEAFDCQHSSLYFRLTAFCMVGDKIPIHTHTHTHTHTVSLFLSLSLWRKRHRLQPHNNNTKLFVTDTNSLLVWAEFFTFSKQPGADQPSVFIRVKALQWCMHSLYCNRMWHESIISGLVFSLLRSLDLDALLTSSSLTWITKGLGRIERLPSTNCGLI